MEEKVMLSEVIEKCRQYATGESDKEVLDEMGSRITVKSYLPILDKMGILYDFYFSKSSLFSTIEGKIIENEVKKFWKILLKYTNIEIDNEDLCNFDNYDLCFPMLHDYIAQFCYLDYDRTCRMVAENMMMAMIKIISTYFEELDSDTLKENSTQIEKLMQTIIENKKLISELNSLVIFNDPKTKEMIENLKKQAVEVAKNK